jgi:hypothetical protein
LSVIDKCLCSAPATPSRPRPTERLSASDTFTTIPAKSTLSPCSRKSPPSAHLPSSTAAAANPRQIKSLSPLRSSDRRKLADQIIADLQLPVPDKPPDDASAEDKAAAAAALTDLRNALLPESAMAARFSTTVGAEARTVGGSVYAAALAPGGEVRVLWVKVDERMYPTGRFGTVHWRWGG